MAKIDKAEIQERVNKVAMEMILKYGLRGLNMIELARECGLAKATLYKIIVSKEDLVREIALQIFDQNIVKVLNPLGEENPPSIASRRFLDNYLNYGIQSQRILTEQIYKEYPLIERHIQKIYDVQMEQVTARYQKWQDEGLIRQDADVTYCIDTLGVINDFYIKNQDYSEEEIKMRLRESFRCMFLGLGIDV